MTELLNSSAPPPSSTKSSMETKLDVDLEAGKGDGNGNGKTPSEESEFVHPLPPPETATTVPKTGLKAPPEPTLAMDDPENPKGWSTGKKIVIDIILCVWVLALTYSSTAYISSLTALETRFGLSQEVGLLGVTLFVVGFAAGPLLFGPASELVGRRKVYVFCGVLFTAFSFGSAFATNTASLLILRFLSGFFGAASINNVPASIGDFTIPATRNRYSILYAVCAFGGPALGPLCSAFIQTQVGYRWNFRVIAIFCGISSLLVACVPETHGPTLLKRRIRKAGNAPPKMTPRRFVAVYKVALARPIIYLFSEPIVALVSIYLSVLYGILYGFFEAFSVVFLEIRGFTEQQYGLTYISLGIGFLLGALILATIGNRLYLEQHNKAKQAGLPTPPEARLGLAFLGAIVSPISLFMFAWTAPFKSVHWIVPCIAEALFGASMLLIFTSFIPYLIDVYMATAASALAAGMASRALFGSLFPLFTLQMYHTLTVQGATSLLAGVACCLAPIPFLFANRGRQMRVRSYHAVSHEQWMAGATTTIATTPTTATWESPSEGSAPGTTDKEQV